MNFVEFAKALTAKEIVLTDEQLRLAEAIADKLKPDTILPTKDTIGDFLDARRDSQ